MTAWFVILWRFAATNVRVKHISAEMVNSNRRLLCRRGGVARRTDTMALTAMEPGSFFWDHFAEVIE